MTLTRWHRIFLLIGILAAIAWSGHVQAGAWVDAEDVRCSSLNKAPIQAAIRSQSASLQACYQKFLLRTPNKPGVPRAGRLVAQFTIQRGKVSQVSIRRGRLYEKQLYTCLQDTIRTWKMPDYARPKARKQRPCTLHEMKAGKHPCYETQKTQWVYPLVRISYPFYFPPAVVSRTFPRPQPRPSPITQPAQDIPSRRTSPHTGASSVMATIRKSRRQLQSCMERLLRHQPNFRLRHGLGIEIAPDGRVARFSFPGPDKLRRCVVRILRNMRFRKSTGTRQICWPIVGHACAPSSWKLL